MTTAPGLEQQPQKAALSPKGHVPARTNPKDRVHTHGEGGTLLVDAFSISSSNSWQGLQWGNRGLETLKYACCVVSQSVILCACLFE